MTYSRMLMPLLHPDPGFGCLLKVFWRQGEPDRVPTIEFW